MVGLAVAFFHSAFLLKAASALRWRGLPQRQTGGGSPAFTLPSYYRKSPSLSILTVYGKTPFSYDKTPFAGSERGLMQS
jgi:hypothetical protein